MQMNRQSKIVAKEDICRLLTYNGDDSPTECAEMEDDSDGDPDYLPEKGIVYFSLLSYFLLKINSLHYENDSNGLLL